MRGGGIATASANAFGGAPPERGNAQDRGKVFTLLTMLMANNLSVYKTVYTFFKVFTSLIINNLSVYTLYCPGEITQF